MYQIKLLVFLLITILSGCSSVYTTPRPDSYYPQSARNSANTSLFSSRSSSLVNAQLEELLNYRLDLPAQNRIAILKLTGNPSWHGYSQSFNQINQAISSSFIKELKGSPIVYDASFLPSLLIPKERTLATLRESAARYQADLLLAYGTSCRSFEKHRFIDPDETKAYCSVEIVVLDVRTGIIPFTHVATNQFKAKKELGDINFRETIKKAELTAISNSLNESAKQLVAFLDTLSEEKKIKELSPLPKPLPLERG